jgi:hypothetical protein
VVSKIRAKNIAAVFILAVAGLCATVPFATPQVGGGTTAPAALAPSLDFEFFKTRVEPVFLKKRPGHARCYDCHSGGIGPAYLEKLTPGSTTWTEEQSRLNFKRISLLVTPGKPTVSHFLMHPLAPEDGGEAPSVGLHSGGRQFASQNDPDWQTLAEWVRGAKASEPAK